MPHRVTQLLRGVLILGFLGSLAVQIIFSVGVITGAGQAPLPARIGLATTLVLALLCVEVAIIAIWTLLTQVARGTVFTSASISRVNTIIGAILGFAVCVLVAGYVVGEIDDAPGVILLGALAAVLVTGVALIVYVQRQLLIQATRFSAELAEVI